MGATQSSAEQERLTIKLIGPSSKTGEELLSAARRFDWPLVERFLEREDGHELAHECDESRVTVFWYACADNKIDIMKKLLDLGASAAVKAVDGATALYIASKKGHNEAVRMCIDYGADPNVARLGGHTPMHVAAIGAQYQTLAILLAGGCDVNSAPFENVTPLHVACKNGNTKCAKLLVMAGARVNANSARGWTPLHEAAFCGHLECVRMCIKRGADIDLMTACKKTAGQTYGGSQAYSVEKFSPIHLACSRGHHACVLLLYRQGANVTQLCAGHTPKQTALLKGEMAVADIFRRNRDDTDKMPISPIPDLGLATWACHLVSKASSELGIDIDMLPLALERAANLAEGSDRPAQASKLKRALISRGTQSLGSNSRAVISRGTQSLGSNSRGELKEIEGALKDAQQKLDEAVLAQKEPREGSACSFYFIKAEFLRQASDGDLMLNLQVWMEHAPQGGLGAGGGVRVGETHKLHSV